MQFIYILLGIILLSHVMGYFFYGGFANHAEIYKIIEKESTVRLNSVTGAIFYVGKLPYIAKFPFCFLFAKWHIEDVGIICRWTKTHRKLEELYYKSLNG